MFHSLLSGSSCAAILGFCGASLLGYGFTAGAVGFMAGSCLGFIIGTVGYFRSSYQQSVLAFVRYPQLIRHYLWAEFGARGVHQFQQFHDEDVNQTVGVVNRSIVLQGMLISAWHSAIPAIEVSGMPITCVNRYEANQFD